MRALCAFLAVLAFASGVEAQTAFPWAPQDADVEWEERREPYDGRALRPGSQVDITVSPLTVFGGIALGAGYVIGAIGATQGRPEAAIPFAGPWLAIGDVFDSGSDWDDLALVAMGVAGVAQIVGVTLLAIGLVNPDRAVVYDAPVGSASPYARIRLDAGPGWLALTAEAF